MPARSDDPLRRVTLNLYEADAEGMEKLYGQGWTIVIREMVHAHLQIHRVSVETRRDSLRTIGDLE